MASLEPPTEASTIWHPDQGWVEPQKLPEPMSEAEKWRLRIRMMQPTWSNPTFRRLGAAGLETFVL